MIRAKWDHAELPATHTFYTRKGRATPGNIRVWLSARFSLRFNSRPIGELSKYIFIIHFGSLRHAFGTIFRRTLSRLRPFWPSRLSFSPYRNVYCTVSAK